MNSQLIRENNEALDKTYVYEYNSIGNLTLVKEYEYYAPEETLPSCYKSIVYEYDSECPDRLTKFDGNEIEYNSIGCPTKYKDENYEWTNGKLSKIHRSKVLQGNEHYMQYTLTYDGYGRRTRKHYISGINYRPADSEQNYSFEHTIDYTYDNNGRLIREFRTDVDTYSGVTKTTRELIYLYDDSGSIIGVMYSLNGVFPEPYYYHRNLQGDVIAIYDANGNKQVEYAYDAWGNCETVYQEDDELAYLNPIRYRGYYYDTETGLYYLNARYYSPEWRRFIQPADASGVNPYSINGLNLYTYACNNPNKIQYKTPLANEEKIGGGMGTPLISGNIKSNNHFEWWVNPNYITGIFGYVENGFSILEGVLAGYRNIKHLPQLENLSKVSLKLMHIGIAFGLVADIYNNFSNKNLTLEEQIIGATVDGLYTIGTTALSYGVSALATATLALIPGVGVFAVLGGALISIGVLGLVDWLVEENGWLDSIKDWIESW